MDAGEIGVALKATGADKFDSAMNNAVSGIKSVAMTVSASGDGLGNFGNEFKEVGKHAVSFTSIAKDAAAHVGGSLKGAFDSANASITKATSGMSSITNATSGMSVAMVALGAAAGVVVAAKQAFNMASEAHGVETASTAFLMLGGNIEELRTATHGMITDAELVKKANLAQTMGINAEQFKMLASVAQAASAKTGQSMQYLFDSIITGTARESKMILDNLGIMINIEDANKKYAEANGLVASSLTDVEKKAAFMNAVMASGNTILGEMAGIDLVNPYTQLSVAVDNATHELGLMFGTVTKNGVPALMDLVETTKRVVAALLDVEGTDWSAVWGAFNSGVKTAADMMMQAVQGGVLLIGVLQSLYDLSLAGIAQRMVEKAMGGTETIAASIERHLADAERRIQGIQKARDALTSGDETAKQGVPFLLQRPPSDVAASGGASTGGASTGGASTGGKAKKGHGIEVIMGDNAQIIGMAQQDAAAVGAMAELLRGSFGILTKTVLADEMAFSLLGQEVPKAAARVIDEEGIARNAKTVSDALRDGITKGVDQVNFSSLFSAFAGPKGLVGQLDMEKTADSMGLDKLGDSFGVLSGMSSSLTGAFSIGIGVVQGVLQGVGEAAKEMMNKWIDSVQDAASKLSSAVQDVGNSTQDLFEKSVVAPGKQVFAESRAGQAGEAGKGVTGAGAAVAAALMGVAGAAVQLIGSLSSFPAMVGVAFNAFVLALATYLLPISPIILAMGSGVAGLLALIVVSTAALAVMVVAVLAVPAALVLFTSAVIGMGIVMFQLSTQTKSYQALQRAFAASMDRIVQALEPFFENMIGLAGLFDALVSVFLPLAASFANGTTLFRLLFDVVKTVAIGLALFAIAVALIATVVLATVIGFATSAKGLLEAFSFVQAGINMVADTMMLSASAILSGILQTFESALPQSVKAGLQGMIDNLSGQVGKGTTTRALTEGLQGIADAATAMSPDIDGMGAALNELTNLTYDEATQRGQILAREKQMSSELTNIPQGFKVAAARFRAIVGESMGAGGTDATAKGGNNFIIDTVRVVADSAEDMADDLMNQATQKSFQQTGGPGVPWRQP